MRLPSPQRFPAPMSVWSVILSAFLVASGVSSAAIYLHIDDIPGESQAVGHEDWIDVLSIGASVDRTTDVTTEVMRRGELVLRKRVDKSSPYLVLATLRQMRIPTVLIEVEEKGQTEICYRLRGVHMVRHDLETSSEGDELVERFHLHFDVGEWHDFHGDPRGRQHVGTTWNFMTNDGGVLDGHLDTGPRIAPIGPIEVDPGKTFQVRIDLLDPSNRPDLLDFSAFAPEEGRIKILGIERKDSQRTLSLQAGTLETGIDEIILSVTDGTRSTTRALPILIGGPRPAYQAYLEGYLGDQARFDPEILRPLRDPDGDGLSNLMEFFLGTNPALPTPRKEAFTMVREQNENGNAVRIQYFRRMDQEGLSEAFEGTFDLSQWGALGPQSEPPILVKQLEAPANGYALMEATIPLGQRADSFFLRLTVQGSL